MNKKFLPLLLAVCLTLSGCASLLERSYSSVEPYTDRYWDSGAEDTLKAESYQDLVNSLLMLIEQRSEEVVIRYYAPEGSDSYAQAVNAKYEVQNETILGSYLLQSLTVIYSSNDGYCTLTYNMTYRENAQDLATLMALSDTQSLVDLLRVALREGHDSVTAQFISKLSREDVLSAVNGLWEEMFLAELEANGYFDRPTDESGDTGDLPPDGGESAEEDDTDSTSGDSENGESPDGKSDLNSSEDEGEDAQPSEEESFPPPIEFPPCPWVIIFYPNANTVEIVEIVLK